MTRLMDIERALEDDPLAIRLSRISVAPMSSDVRVALSAAIPPRPAPRRRRRWGAAAAVAAVVVSLALFVTPAGAALARAVLPSGLQQFFGIVSGAPTQLIPPGGASAPHGPTSQTGSSAASMPCSKAAPLSQVVCLPDLSLTDTQRGVDFIIPTPAMLPAGVSFRGGLVDSPRSAYISYRLNDGAPGGLAVWIKEGTPMGGPAVPTGSIQAAEVDGSPAYYVHGDYEDSGPGTVASWNPNADAEELTWQHNGLTFDLTAGSLQLSKVEFFQIAESVR
jgi:hypothetical protein